MKLTSESTWKELCIALAKRQMTLCHGIPDREHENEYHKETLILIDNVWTKQAHDNQIEGNLTNDIEVALRDCSSDQEDEAADFLEEKHNISTMEMDRNDVIAEAIRLGWEPWPEPYPEYGEPPITSDEMHTEAHKQHIALHS